MKNNEIADVILEDLKAMFEEDGIDVPDAVVDRAHRIGQGYTDSKTKQKCKSTIIRFSTFRHRTRVYRAKKNLKKGVKVHLDLTKRRYKLLQDANSLVKDNREVKFCYADINCRLKVKWNDNLREDNLFSSMNELEDLLSGN